MLVAMHNGKRVCSLDTKNTYGNYEYEILETLKKASQNHELYCEECGEEVFLRAGEIKIPHFAHKSLSKNCYFNDKRFKESEEHKKGKLALYTFLKQKFNNCLVEVDYHLSNNRRTNVYVETPTIKLAFEYLRNDMNLNLWEEKHKDYKKIGVKDYWILSAKDFRKNYKSNIKFFKKFIEKNDNDKVIKLLDTDTNTISFLKYLEFRDEDDKLVDSKPFSRSYVLGTLNIDEHTGQFVTNFMNEYKITQNHFNKKWQRKLESSKKQITNMPKPYKTLIQELPLENIKLSRNTMLKRNNKSKEELKREALECKRNNPQGPWYDSTRLERWGICEKCGAFTNKWTSFKGKTNTCICYECR